MSQPGTSLDAYASLDEDDVTTLARRILEAAKAEPGTSRHLAARLGLDAERVWKRASDLLNAGYLRRDGRGLNADTGREASLLKPTEAGLEWLASGEPLDTTTSFRASRRDAFAAILRTARDITRTSAAEDPVRWVQLHEDLKAGFTRLDAEAKS